MSYSWYFLDDYNMISKLPFVVIDVETTGSHPVMDRIIEIGAVKVLDGQVIDTLSTFINPGRNIPPTITWLTGITNRHTANAPSFFEEAERISNFLKGQVFVAHNALFDYRFVNAELVRSDCTPLENSIICTLQLARRTFPGLIHYNLGDLCRTLKIHHERAHRANADALATAHLLIRMIKKLTACGFEELGRFQEFYERSPKECAALLQA